MHYIVFDLEFNQDIVIPEETLASQSDPLMEASDIQSSPESASSAPVMKLPFEIVQIGAVKLNQEFHTIAAFNRLVKPSLYTTVSPFITGLTGITTDQLIMEPLFPEVYQDFTAFIGDTDSVFCVWGKTDMKELFRNVCYHNLNKELLPTRYINIQPYASLHQGLPKKKLPRLKNTAEALDIPLSVPFHDAGNDAYYTAEIFKKLYKSSMQPKVFEPGYRDSRPRTPKKIIDFDMLLHQFEKMYGREMTVEEQGIIKLAYQMGKTQQFLKEV